MLIFTEQVRCSILTCGRHVYRGHTNCVNILNHPFCYTTTTIQLLYNAAEETLGKWFADTGRRGDIFLATKFGSRDPDGKYYDGKRPVSAPSYIKVAVERSLKRLGTSYIDLYYQHRVDPDVPIEVVLETLRPYVENGTIRWLGLSECSAETLRRAKAVKGVGEKVIAAQMEYSPFSLQVEKDGFAKAAKELGVAIVAYSPLGRGLVSGRYAGYTC